MIDRLGISDVQFGLGQRIASTATRIETYRS